MVLNVVSNQISKSWSRSSASVLQSSGTVGGSGTKNPGFIKPKGTNGIALSTASSVMSAAPLLGAPRAPNATVSCFDFSGDQATVEQTRLPELRTQSAAQPAQGGEIP